MRLLNINGRATNKNVHSRLIDWNAKSKSKFQKEIKELLYPYWKNHVVYEEFPVYSTRLTLDLYNATKNIAIEAQGSQHTEFNPFFHKSQHDLLHQYKNDILKRQFCELNKIELVEIFYEEKNKLSTAFLKEIGVI